ncbi:MAG: PD-(D/E)XK nuclease family protein [Nitrososphaera sp.]|nr:PD-(D/E)XK nuclease family protein [Nitrososphaera sp.]
MIEHLSASQIQGYLDCSLKYKLNYIDRLPKPFKPAALALGSALHAAVEWLHRKWSAGNGVTLEMVWQIFEADWYAQALDEISYKDGETGLQVLNLGKKLLSVYFEHAPRDGIVESELPFQVPLTDLSTGESLDISLAGIFDKIEEGDVVADLKTWSRTVSQEDLDSNIQLSAYAYAYRMLYGKDPSLRLDVLLKTKTPRLEQFSTTRTEADHLTFFALCREVYNGIQKEVFLPNPSWKCRDCEYRQNCWFWKGKN